MSLSKDETSGRETALIEFIATMSYTGPGFLGVLIFLCGEK